MWPVLLVTVALLAAANDKAIGATDHECVKSAEEIERIRSLALEAIDQALKIHIAQLYGIGLHDSADAPRRSNAGIKNGLRVYHRARADIMAWNPPVCR
jgi:hypothetical protein